MLGSTETFPENIQEREMDSSDFYFSFLDISGKGFPDSTTLKLSKLLIVFVSKNMKG